MWLLVILMGLGVPLALWVVSVLGSKKGSFEVSRLESFECGFEAVTSARSPFCLKFFMVVVVFLVFDVEVVLVLPMPLAKSWMSLSAWGWVSLFIMVILILGLVLECEQGVFEWSV